MSLIRKSYIGCILLSVVNILVIIGILTLESHVVSPINQTGLQNNRRTVENETCFPKKLYYVNDRNVNRSRIALASFPGSGNTWTRHLIQQSTGYYTGSVYRDGRLANKGFPGELAKINDIEKQCIVYKTHKGNSSTLQSFKKALILIRNPLDSVKAYFNFKYGDYYKTVIRGRKTLRTKNKTSQNLSTLVKKSRQKRETHTGAVPPAVFKSPVFRKFLIIQISKWKLDNTFWLRKYHRKSLVVLYENLKHDLPTELMKIVTFLDVQVEPEDIACTVKNKEGRFHRKEKKSAEVDLLSILNKEQIEMIKDAVCRVHNVARQLHIDLDILRYLKNFPGLEYKKGICKQGE